MGAGPIEDATEEVFAGFAIVHCAPGEILAVDRTG